MKRRFIKLLLWVYLVALSAWLGLIVFIWYHSKIDNAQIADAIVVMGASQWNGKPSPVFQARLDAAYDLYINKYASKIILTGGIGEGEKISEASAGESYLIRKGISEECLFKEEIGKTSKESLDEVVSILRLQDINSIILVSDGFHMMRLKKMAKDLNVQAFSRPIDHSPINKSLFSQLKYYFRESMVYILYLLFEI